jgi:LmbE family N-acetylglucosaminyl deacetylase
MTMLGVLLRRLSRGSLLLVARRPDSLAMRRSTLVVAPHPDDETIGCGARILRGIAAGAEITVVVLTEGEAAHSQLATAAESIKSIRRTELQLAGERLGIPSGRVIQLQYPDGLLAEHVPAVATDLARILDECHPDEIYVTCGQERHADHAAASRAAHAAVGDRSGIRLFEYPVWLWADWPVSRRHANGRAALEFFCTLVRRRVERVRVRELQVRKAHALAAYESQLASPDRPEGATGGLPDAVVQRALQDELFFVARGPGRRAK